MAQKPEAHPKHSEQEYIIASIGGVGVLLAMLAGMFSAFGASDNLFGLEYNVILGSGVFLIAFAFIFWMVGLRPWEQFDDLKTPYYTGHHDHHEEHEEPISEMPSEDLTLIEGIGEKVQAALLMKGITTFEQLAQAEVSDLQALLKAAGLSHINPSSWAKQAQYIVDGDVQGFEAYQASLKGSTVEDLQRVEGIGPKAKEALVAAGITTFAKLAASSEEERLQALEAAGVNTKLVKPATWAKQAQYIVDGDVAGFEAYKKHLVGGVEPTE